VVVVLITLIYGITYSIEPESYALLGIAGAIAMRRKSADESSAVEFAPWSVDSTVNVVG
jgi:hypothetical protein